MSNDKARFHFYARDLIALGVVALLGLSLLAMSLLPAIDGGGPGRNTQCKNNIRQLAMAVDTHQNHAGYYPGRMQTIGGRSAPWVVALLPGFERLDLYKEWNDPAITNKPTPYLELLVCPQDADQLGGLSLSYVANAGIADLADTNIANGVFFDHTQFPSTTIRTDDLVDGKSNTIIFSENLQATTWDSVQPYETIFVWHAAMQPTQEMLINGGDLRLPVTAKTARPSSKHRGGVNVAFADSHVTFLRSDIDYGVYAQLMTPDDRASDMPDAWKVPLDDRRLK